MTIATRARQTGHEQITTFENPFDNNNSNNDNDGGARGPLGAAPANIFGVSSIETFADVNGLSATHEDADGFWRYLANFYAENFRFRDDGVQYWQYTEPYDDWQDRYGTDAVRVFYHSGHGGMDDAGAFRAPLGKEWGGRTSVSSNDVLQGNERLRYIFWSTCLSLRVLDGHTPIRTWNATDRGVRMFFGWETVSWDRSGYGEWFWNHWRSGQSLATAWLNSGWDGGHDQAPSVAACGATPDEAQNRVNNERLFSDAPASSAWWWWRWYGAAKSLSAATRAVSLPSTAYRVRFASDEDLPRQLGSIGETTPIGSGRHYVAVDTARVEPTRDRLSRSRLLRSATAMVSALDLHDVELEPSMIRPLHSEGGSAGGDGERTDRYIDGYAVEFRQMIGGRSIINPDAGFVRVHLNADGSVTGADVATRSVAELAEVAAVGAPPVSATQPADASAPDLDAFLSRAVQRALTRTDNGPIESAPTAVSSSVVPDSRQVGYVVDGSQAVLGATEGVEVDFGQGYRKKVPVTVRLNG